MYRYMPKSPNCDPKMYGINILQGKIYFFSFGGLFFISGATKRPKFIITNIVSMGIFRGYFFNFQGSFKHFGGEFALSPRVFFSLTFCLVWFCSIPANSLQELAASTYPAMERCTSSPFTTHRPHIGSGAN